ncbi:aspartate kinase [Liquorilactobacillus aquaticus DSM 21051]|uniref:Aspartokinase n=1 Tax=Liquorilactobacillus aquaticus DSM 21051 TaxID=1423725 RepID=A0A0R2CZ66_9LACO|nr:aspartate kinase [Liquorilactobacillus aquaticus]KRM97073.1 aspartate kinase [Liquorilactobacillus aquaticus DSM 21051]
MKITKFGGSSLASAQQFRKVFDIIKSDRDRKVVVVSAPGKRFSSDTKITDNLITLAKEVQTGQDIEKTLAVIKERYVGIIEDLGLKQEIKNQLEDNLKKMITASYSSNNQLLNTFKASGEDNNAQLVAAYFNENGLPAKYVSPEEAGLLVSAQDGHTRVLSETYANLERLTEVNECIIFPGFFGVSKENQRVTFSRGGSDITGAILAKGLKADLYENFTDVDAIFAANPQIVDQPQKINHLTYQEMRELSYAGFSVLHHEALRPAIMADIPIRVKNTNKPELPGTLISKTRSENNYHITGIASSRGFMSISIAKYLMNEEVGFGAKALNIMAEHNLSVEHVPTGIDEITLILRADQFKNEADEKELLQELQEKLNADKVYEEKELALLMIVGEGMISTVGTAAKAMASLAKAGINLKMIDQGSSEISMLFGIAASDENSAIAALYESFFKSKIPVEEK